MTTVQICSTAVLLAVSAGAWAGTWDGIEPYPSAVQGEDVSTKTRAQVIAELHEAMRLGLIVNGERDFPVMTPVQVRMIAAAGERAGGHDLVAQGHAATYADDVVVVWGNSRVVRVKIQAEASEANRLGLLSFGEGDPPIATAEQEQQIAAAGRRAVDALRVAENVALTAAR